MFGTDERGQSSTLAVGLVVALALTTALLVAGIGATTLSASKQVAEVDESVNALSELDSEASLVALGDGNAATVDLGLGGDGGRTTVHDAGRFRLVLNRSEGGRTELANTSLGTVEYANGDHRVAYQGGGVWRRHLRGNGSVMISPPQVHYRDGTLTLPMITVTGTAGGLDRARIVRNRTERVYPRSGVGTNPIPAGDTLVAFVSSEYYRAWANYFERRIGANVTRFDGNQTVRVELVSHRAQFQLASGLVSVGTGSPIDMQGSGGDPTFVDSYDSSDGPYNRTQSGNGTVLANGGLDMGGTSYIDGNLNTGGSAKLNGNSTIYGNARHQGLTINGQHSSVTGWEAKNGSGPEVPPIDSLVQSKVDAICSRQPPTHISGGETLSDPSYCIDGDIDLDSGETLTIDLSSNDVNVSVKGDIDVHKATIRLRNVDTNNHTARIWLAGDSVTVKSGNVTVPGDDATALTVYGGSDTAIWMGGAGNNGEGSTFVGLIFAPTSTGSGSLTMHSHSELFGSAVTGLVDMQGGSAVHYDKALAGFTVDRGDARAASDLSYLHVSINEVRIRAA